MERIDGTRGELLALLRRSPRTVSELATELGISGNAVRQHLASALVEGVVEEGPRRATGGKPARVYRLTAAGEEAFPKAYAFVLSALVGALRERLGGAEARALLRGIGEAGAEAGGGPAPGDLEARLVEASRVLASLGGDVVVERAGGGWMVRGAGCPLSSVVTDQPEACGVVEGLLAGMTGQVVRECCERGERPRCAFLVLGG